MGSNNIFKPLSTLFWPAPLINLSKFDNFFLWLNFENSWNWTRRSWVLKQVCYPLCFAASPPLNKHLVRAYCFQIPEKFFFSQPVQEIWFKVVVSLLRRRRQLGGLEGRASLVDVGLTENWSTGRVGHRVRLRDPGLGRRRRGTWGRKNSTLTRDARGELRPAISRQLKYWLELWEYLMRP